MRGAALALAAGMTLLIAADPPAVQVTAPPARRAMALTFDDLPYVYVAPADGATLAVAQRATAALLRALASRQAPAVGFVNEDKLGSGAEIEARTALLQGWVDSGAILGNHTYSHVDLNTRTIAQFEEEIRKGEVVTRRLMRPRHPYPLYFRHPFTHTGDTREKKEAIEAFLGARGYVVAPHTIDSEDYLFNVPYARALAAHDTAAAERLRAAYLTFVIEATGFAERVSVRIFGREIPQTILLHANAINADALEELLDRLGARGYEFVPLDRALADPAYRTRDTFVTSYGPTWLWRWTRSLGLEVSFAEDPEPPGWVTAPPAPAAR
jgi:peptidoglycan/xylan/chitin deacetylase (PgdA/CDA1 family)